MARMTEDERAELRMRIFEDERNASNPVNLALIGLYVLAAMSGIFLVNCPGCDAPQKTPPLAERAIASVDAVDAVDVADAADPCDQWDVNSDGIVDVSDMAAVRDDLAAVRACLFHVVETIPPYPECDEWITGNQGPLSGNPIADQQRQWCIIGATVNGGGADTSIYAVGRDCVIRNSSIDGGKHGIRVASVNGLEVANCRIWSSDTNKGSAIKICGIGDKGPASRNILVENCTIYGWVTIKPQNPTNALLENIENVTIRNCVIRPWGNTGVRIAATNVWCENVTVDFRNTPVSDPVAFVVTNYNGCMPKNVTIRYDCKILTNDRQNPHLIEADIIVKRE